MAITRMKKVFVFAHEKNREAVLERLQRIGMIEIEAAMEDVSSLERAVKKREAVDAGLEGRLKRGLSFLRGFEAGSKGLIDSFFPRKFEIRLEELEKEMDIELLLKIEALEGELTGLERREMELAEMSLEIEPWKNLNLDFADVREGEKTVIRACSTKAKFIAGFIGNLDELKPSPIVLNAETVRDEKYFILIYSKSVSNDIERLFDSFEIRSYSLNYKGKPREILGSIEKEIERLSKEKEELKRSAEKILTHEKKLLLLSDSLLVEKERNEVAKLLAKTEKAVVISGWCPEKYLETLTTELKKIKGAVEIYSRDPKKNEKPPVVLENKLSAPFEAVTKIYGMPRYSELDPTPFLAPFFAVFFGLALTDAGYGVVLTGLSFLLYRKIKNQEAKKLFKLLMLGGISTILLGAATGGWFGNLFAKFGFARLDALNKKIMVFDPIEDPILMLLISLGLGFIHVFLGYALNLYKITLRHEKKEAISQGAFLVILSSIALILIGNAAGTFGKLSFTVSFLILILNKGFLGAFAMLYGLMGYLGDVLSYSRLLALGMATGVIAIVVNEIASMALGVPYVGFIICLIILLIGHGFNIAINVLGAFIHSSRLQFVEFFTKFFEGGGRIFKPFVIKTRYTEVKEW